MENIDYSYTIGPSLLLGVEPQLLKVVVIALAAILTGINISINWIKTRKNPNLLSNNSVADDKAKEKKTKKTGQLKNRLFRVIFWVGYVCAAFLTFIAADSSFSAFFTFALYN